MRNIQVIFKDEIPKEVLEVIDWHARYVLGYCSPRKINWFSGLVIQARTPPTILIDKILQSTARDYNKVDNKFYLRLSSTTIHELVHFLSESYNEEYVQEAVIRMIQYDPWEMYK